MHECPMCNQACDCDGEDLWQEAPDDCQCECLDDDLDEWDRDDDEWFSEDWDDEG